MEHILKTAIEDALALALESQNEIRKILIESEDETISLRFAVKIKGAIKTPEVETSISFSENHKHSTSRIVEDPDQTKLDI